jgi:hypothetical protein
MKFGFRIPNLNKRIAARTSVKRIIRHNLGFKAPRGWGWITDPMKAAYNRVYNRTSRGCMISLLYLFLIPAIILAYIFGLGSCSGDNTNAKKPVYVSPSIDYKGKFRKGYVRKPISTSKNAIKNQNRSKYYYHTRAKYRRKSKD